MTAECSKILIYNAKINLDVQPKQNSICDNGNYLVNIGLTMSFTINFDFSGIGRIMLMADLYIYTLIKINLLMP